MNVLPKSQHPRKAKYNRTGPLTDELMQAIEKHSRIGVLALAKRLNISQYSIRKYREQLSKAAA